MQASILQTFQAHPKAVTVLATVFATRRVVSGSLDETMIVWDLKTGNETSRLHGQTSYPTVLAAFPVGDFIASGNQEGQLILWNTERGEYIRTLVGHTRAITALCVTRDGKRIVSGSADGTLRIWDSVSGRQLRVVEGIHAPTSMIISQDDRYVVLGENGQPGDAQSRLQVWDLDQGKQARVFAHQHFGITDVAFSRNYQQLITGSTEGDLRVWDWQQGTVVRNIETHLASAITAVTPNRRYAIIGTQKPVLTIWNIETGKQIHTLDTPSDWVSSLAITPDNQMIVVGCRNGIINLYALHS